MAFSRMKLRGQSIMRRKATALLIPFMASSSSPQLSPLSFSLPICLGLSSQSSLRWPNGGSRAIVSVERIFGVYPPLTAATTARSFSSSSEMFSASIPASNGSGSNEDTLEVKPKIPSVVPGIPKTDATSETWQNPRSRWARRKHRKKMENMQLQQGEKNGIKGMGSELEDDRGALDWESFEFGTSPKMDKRFNNSTSTTNETPFSNATTPSHHALNTIPVTSITYQNYLQTETTLDIQTSKQTLLSQSDLLSLSPSLVQKSLSILIPYIQTRRLERIDSVLSQRTRHTRFLFENPSNPSNVWACLRTLDSFGIQYVDVVVDSEQYQGKAAVNQKRGMRTAMGSACWMTVRQFGSVEEAVGRLREEEGCLIYASNLDVNARDVRDLEWDVDFDDSDDVGNGGGNNKKKEQRPICIVMGNEERGISDKMKELADETFYLPMCGFAESFNLSVATAITLAYMSAVSSRSGDCALENDGGDGNSEKGACKGPLRPGDLDPHELQCLRLKGVINSLAQKRMAKALLTKEGIVLPSSLYN
mmetsp:Transcript_30677/g.61273  ORF Transcript_30677/g.61273 Transcript_30677/m.61273 type:complete len:535 (+) Transcript_30677:97-1701(+)